MVSLVCLRVFRWVFFNANRAPEVSAVSSLLPTSMSMPIWTADGNEALSVRTVYPFERLVTLYSAWESDLSMGLSLYNQYAESESVLLTLAVRGCMGS